MTREEMTKLIEAIRNHIMSLDECKDASEEEVLDMLMDALFAGFEAGDLHRSDLALAADILGFEISEEFMNDPHPDPIDMKGKK